MERLSWEWDRGDYGTLVEDTVKEAGEYKIQAVRRQVNMDSTEGTRISLAGTCKTFGIQVV